MTAYVADLGIINALGTGKSAVLAGLLQGDQSGMIASGPLLTGRDSRVGTVSQSLDALPPEFAEFDCRNNRLLVAAAAQIDDRLRNLCTEYGPDRIGVLIGTSTSGIAAGEDAIDSLTAGNGMPADYHYRQQEIGTAAEFLAQYLRLDGPRYTVSTACSSSAKVFASGERLFRSSLVAVSTISPKYITATRSEMYSTTERSCEMNK